MLTLQHGEEAAARAASGEPAGIYEIWLEVLSALLGIHRQKILLGRRRSGTPKMTRLKYKLYAFRNTESLKPLRPYWLSSSCQGMQETQIDEQEWTRLEGQAPASSPDLPTAFSGNLVDRAADNGRPPTGVMHQQHGGHMHRRWSLYIPESHYSCSSPTEGGTSGHRGGPSTPLVIALHGARTICDEHLLTWLPTARKNCFAVLALQSLGRSWGIRREDQTLSDVISLLLTLQHVLQEYPRLDSRRIYLTGMSDGGSFSYLLTAMLASAGIEHFGAGVAVAAAYPLLHRMTLEDIQQYYSACPLHHVHSPRDWMFPIELVRKANAKASLALGVDSAATQPDESEAEGEEEASSTEHDPPASSAVYLSSASDNDDDENM